MNLPRWEQDVATVQPVISEPLTTQLAAQSQTDQPNQECDSPQFLEDVLSPWSLVFCRVSSVAFVERRMAIPIKPPRQAFAGGVPLKESCAKWLL